MADVVYLHEGTRIAAINDAFRTNVVEGDIIIDPECAILKPNERWLSEIVEKVRTYSFDLRLHGCTEHQTGPIRMGRDVVWFTILYVDRKTGEQVFNPKNDKAVKRRVEISY